MTRVEVCPEDELPSGERVLVDVDGTAVGVLNVEGEYYAIANECVHQGGPVCAGKVQPELVAEFEEPGERVRERPGDRPVIACPWHGWEYDLETGDHLGDDSLSLPTYDVVFAGGTLYLDV